MDYFDFFKPFFLHTFCCHVRLESIYMQYNRAAIKLTFNTIVLPFPVQLLAGYQIHDKNYIFTSRINYPCLDSNDTLYVNALPSWTLHFNQQFVYVWYVTNHIDAQLEHFFTYTTRFGRNYKYKRMMPYLAFSQISISVFTCVSSDTTLDYYPGLLPWHLIKWHVKPIKTIQCSTFEPVSIETNFHMFATVVLRHSGQGLNLRMIFETGSNTSVGIINQQSSYVDLRQSGSVTERDLTKQNDLNRGTIFIRTYNKRIRKANLNFNRFRALTEHTTSPRYVINPHHSNASYFSIPLGKYVYAFWFSCGF